MNERQTTTKSERRLYLGPCHLGEHGTAGIVAVVNEFVGDWAAYIGSSGPGASRQALMEEVARSGDKLWQRHAEAIFPRLAEQYEWRP